MSKICSGCKIDLSGPDAYCIDVYIDGKLDRHLCWTCDKNEVIRKYKETGEMSSRLLGDAYMCQYYMDEAPDRFAGMRRESALYYTQNALTLLEINRDYNKIKDKFKEFEAKHWLPKLREQYKKSKYRGHMASTEDWKAMMWGSAGRVLITLQDTRNFDDPNNKFGGAWITFIFDDSSTTATGGVQGMCATKKEALDLTQAAIDGLPEMKPDEAVHLAGL